MENKWTIKKARKRHKLVAAALELYRKKGYHNCRIEDIIAKAQVGKGTFYLYFKNKEDMVDQLMNEFVGEIKDTLQWVVDNMTDEASLDEIFRQEAHRLVASMDRHRQLARFVFREGRSVSPELDKKIMAFYEELVEMSENTFALAMAAGMIPAAHPRVSALIVIGGIVQIYQHWLEGKVEGKIEELVESGLVFFNRALGVIVDE